MQYVRIESGSRGDDETDRNKVRSKRQELHEKRSQQLIVRSLAVTLEKIMNRADVDVTTEIIQILHEKYFDLEVFRDDVRSPKDCQTITEGIIIQV